MTTVLDTAVSNNSLKIPLKINFYLLQSLDRGRFRVRESWLLVINLIFQELRKRLSSYDIEFCGIEFSKFRLECSFSSLYCGITFGRSDKTMENHVLCYEYQLLWLGVHANRGECMYYNVVVFSEVLVDQWNVMRLKRTVRLVNGVRQFKYSDCTGGKTRRLPSA